MYDFAILCDATSDLTEQIRKRFDIDYIKGHIVLADRKDYACSLEWDIITRDEFYTSLSRKDISYSTSPANIDEYAERFRFYAEKGMDVLSLSLSSGLSGTYSFALKASEIVSAEYPDRKIICVDSLRYSTLCGLMAVYASEMRHNGSTIGETATWLENNKNRFHQMGWVDDLTFLARKGRITNSKAFFGRLVGVKPLGDIDYNGLTTVLGKAKGEKAALETIIRYIERTITEPEKQLIFVAQSYRDRQAEILKAMIEERFHPREIIMTQVFAGCGVNIGPGLMAAYYIGQPISAGLENEKRIMTELLG